MENPMNVQLEDIKFEDLKEITQESLKAHRISNRHHRWLQHNVIQAVKSYQIKNLLNVKKTPEELHTFSTFDEGLPLLHLVLKYYEKEKETQVLDFLLQVPDLGIICSQKSVRGELAGECYSKEAKSILNAACKSPTHIRIVEALLKARTKTDQFVDDLSPLMVATVHNNTRAIHVLLSHKARVDKANANNETSLLLACRHKQWEAARILYDHEANVFHEDKEGDTPFRVAITGRGIDFIRHMSQKSERVIRELQQNVSPEDLCRCWHAALWPDIELENESEQRLDVLIREASQHRNIVVLKQLVSNIKTLSLASHITEAFKAGRYDCVDALVRCCTVGAELPRLDIDLKDTCKHHELINLTRFLVETGHVNINEGGGEPLRVAAKHGNLKAAQFLIDNGAQIDAADTHRMTPLLFACENNHLDMVDMLLKRNADVNVASKETPLTAACKKNNIKIIERLLKDTSDLEQPNMDGMTPLQVAVEDRHASVVTILVKNGASPTACSLTLQKICRVGNLDLARCFIESVDVTETLDKVSVDALITQGNTKLLEYLIRDARVPKSPYILTCVLQKSCEAGCVDIIRLLIDYQHDQWQFDPDDVHFHLNHAIQHSHPKAVKLLLEQGCDPLKGDCPITAAMKSEKILSWLQKYDLPEQKLKVALLAACNDKNIHDGYCVRELLKKIKDVNYTVENDGSTPLLAACLKSSVSLVKLLLSEGANPNCYDKWHRTPLYVACVMEHREIASLLLYNKNIPADPNICLYIEEALHKFSPLWEACTHGYLDLVELLLDHKANANLQDENGYSLLYQTHEKGQHEVVRLLLERNPNTSTLTNFDLEIACQYGYTELALNLFHKLETSDRHSELIEGCIAEACLQGFPETGLSIVIEIVDCETKNRFFETWSEKQSQRSRWSLSSSSTQPKKTSVREEDPLWQSLLQQDNDRFKQLLEDGQNPNTENESGTPLLHKAIQNRNSIAAKKLLDCKTVDVHARDELGRTALFYALNLMDASVFEKLKKRGADLFVTDYFGRSLLHEWKPREGEKGVTIPISRSEVNQVDCKKQTPLHLAVLQQNDVKVKMLLDAESDPNAKDINGISPFELSRQQRNIHCIFVDKCRLKKEKLDNDVQQESVYFSKVYPFAHRVVHPLNQVFQCSTKDSVSVFQEGFEDDLVISKHEGFNEELKSFCETVKGFMEDLSQEIEKEDPLFHFTPVMSGSCSEGTKVMEMNEADVLCKFTHSAWEKVEISQHEPNDFSYIKLESAELAQRYPRLFTNGILSVRAVFQRFYFLVRKHVAKVLPDRKKLYIRNIQSILQNNYAITPMEFVWSGDINRWQEFDVDVVPAISVPQSKIPEKLIERFPRIHDLVAVPKWTAGLMDKSYTDEAFQFGFSLTEKDFFYTMPRALIQGYKLTKVALHKCLEIDGVPAGDFISSYMLKCKTFECFKELSDFDTKIATPVPRDLFADELEPPKDVIEWANKILSKLEENVKEQHLESFFLPGSNLLAHTTYSGYQALMYVQMCHAFINSPLENPGAWTRLVNTVAQQLLQPRNFSRSQDDALKEVKLLLGMGLDVNVRGPQGYSLLYFMIKQGSEDGVRTLMGWQASVENVDGQGADAIHVAEKMKKKNLMKYFHSDIEVPDSEQHRVIRLGDYIVACSRASRLGKGRFGNVWVGEREDYPTEKVAVKEIQCQCVQQSGCTCQVHEQARNAVDTHACLKHRNIVKFYTFENIQWTWFIVMELCDGDLNELYKRAPLQVPARRSVRYMEEMASGLMNMHIINICHRDIKPQNILIKNDIPKLSDFGLAMHIRRSSSVSTRSIVGTYGWIAPELPSRYYSFPVDIFSMGLVFLSMVCHEVEKSLVPLTGDDNIPLGTWMQARREDTASLPVQSNVEWVKQLLGLIKHMLHRDPSNRIDITGVCECIQDIKAMMEGQVHADDPIPVHPVAEEH